MRPRSGRLIKALWLAYANRHDDIIAKGDTMSLSEVGENKEAVISNVSGDSRFMSRITSIGLTPGSKIRVIKNDKNRPVLVYSKDTMIALNRNECKGISVEEVKA